VVSVDSGQDPVAGSCECIFGFLKGKGNF